ncbi:MAG TPA: bifunctional UDP-N-acetylglucosamine diphosphorylase/glucosamine-1-phosphate N-acetyltransferase GlmU, partial [Actinomycetes bacterium]|nr:bifunctional UDP-N-acetylglucosamine diphosphorylase/glucosamine-1-phosphate N-acetyltransferase GlmU [Actinomycetes bacterium]
MSSTRPAAVIVLAAGEGTRMRSATPKVLHEIAGRSLLGHALTAARALDPEHLIVVVGHGRDRVETHLAEIDPAAKPVVQASPNGTGHAVRVALDAVGELDGPVVVTYGDVPLLGAATLDALLQRHVSEHAAITLLSVVLDDPTGYGRIIRNDETKDVVAIVEQKDATPDERAIKETNAGVYVFDGQLLRTGLSQLTTDNVQGEEYLTDVLAVLRNDGHRVVAVSTDDPHEVLGVNDRAQLAELGRILRDRLVGAAMRDGVTVVDPSTTWLDVDVTLERDVVLKPNVQLLGRTHIHEGAVVGPDSTLTDTTIGPDAHVDRTVATSAVIGAGAHVGPFTYLRPGTRLERSVKAGAFVEMKNADVGEGAKVPHLSYVGDADIGEGTNLGAGTITANYDGRRKHRTTIGNRVRVSVDTSFVAPVTIG